MMARLSIMHVWAAVVLGRANTLISDHPAMYKEATQCANITAQLAVSRFLEFHSCRARPVNNGFRRVGMIDDWKSPCLRTQDQ